VSWVADAVEALPKLVGLLRGQVDPCLVAEDYAAKAEYFRAKKAEDMRYHRKEIRAAKRAAWWRRRCEKRKKNDG
jgi:hypothetical protein